MPRSKTTSTEHAAIIAGGGPTGMMLAAELALAGVDVAVIERRATPDLVGSRAGGLHARTLEVLDQRGVVDRFIAAGQIAQAVGFGMIRLDISDFPTRHPYSLGLWQNRIERIMADWIGELPVTVYRGLEVTDLRQDEAGVNVALSDGGSIRTGYLVGCDGGHSRVRKAAGIAFPGWAPTISCLIAEVEMTGQPDLGVRQDAVGLHGISRVDYEVIDGKVVDADTGPMRIMLTEPQLVANGEPSLDDLSRALISVYGSDYGVHSPTWISRFTDAARQAAAYRRGRVLLAGDAAHIHAPDGGQGLNLGVQDAANLGWKLAQVIKGASPDSLLDTYHAERHPVGAQVLQTTMAQVALRRADDRTKALRSVLGQVLALDESRKRIAGELSGLSVCYDLGDGHPLLGRRMPDLELAMDEGPRALSTLLHEAWPLLINFAESGAVYAGAWAGRVRSVNVRYEGEWVLPVIGAVAAPAAVLIRPDGYVAWVGEGTRTGLDDALATWFGPAN